MRERELILLNGHVLTLDAASATARDDQRFPGRRRNVLSRLSHNRRRPVP